MNFSRGKNTRDTFYVDQEWACPSGRIPAMKEVERINEPDVAIYTVIINDGCNGASGGVGTACDNEEFKKVAIARGPTRGVIETAEVGMVINFSISSTCLMALCS